MKWFGESLAFTPKEFRHIAQGCRASRLPWVCIATDRSTLKGLRQSRTMDDGTPLGNAVTYFLPRNTSPQRQRVHASRTVQNALACAAGLYSRQRRLSKIRHGVARWGTVTLD